MLAVPLAVTMAVEVYSCQGIKPGGGVRGQQGGLHLHILEHMHERAATQADNLNWGRVKLVYLLFKGKVIPRLCIAEDVPTNSSREMPAIDLIRWCDIQVYEKQDSSG